MSAMWASVRDRYAAGRRKAFLQLRCSPTLVPHGVSIRSHGRCHPQSLDGFRLGPNADSVGHFGCPDELSGLVVGQPDPLGERPREQIAATTGCDIPAP
jgi:hypothetical protein